MRNALDDLHVGRFGHGVGRFDQRDQALGFNQSNGILHGMNTFVVRL